MAKYEGLAPEERARITEIQDSLIERFVAPLTLHGWLSQEAVAALLSRP